MSRSTMVAACCCAIAVPAPAAAAPRADVLLDLPAGPLSAALIAFTQQTGISVGFAGRLPGRSVARLRGRMTPAAALRGLLKTTGLVAVALDPRTFRIQRAPRPAPPKPIARRPVSPTPSPSGAPVDIVVTATKRSERMSVLAGGVSIVEPDRVRAAGFAAATGLVVRMSEGLTLTSFGPGRNRLFIRGIADSAISGPSQSTVTLMLDESRYSYSSPDPDLRLIDVDRVEVLKGPQGTLYGSGALGGIYRIVTRKPDLAEAAGELAVGGGITAHGEPSTSLEGTVNLPIDDALALRGSAYRSRDGGWIDNPGRADTDVNRVSTRGGRLAMRWLPDRATTVDLTATMQASDADDAQYATSPSAPLVNDAAIAQPYRSRLFLGGATVTRMLGTKSLIATASIARQDTGNLYDASMRAAERNLPTPLAVHDRERQTLHTQEIRLADEASRFRWLAGISLLHVSNRTMLDLGPADEAEATNSETIRSASEIALFGEFSIPLSSQFDVRLGARNYSSKTAARAAGTTFGAQDEVRQSGWTGSVSARWMPAPDRLVYLRYADADRPGGIDTSATPTATFRSDSLRSAEIGARIALSGGRVHLSGAAFAIRWRNVQSDILLDDGRSSTRNIGHAVNHGLEAAMAWSPGRATLELGITRQKGGLTPDLPASADAADLPLPLIPENVIRLGAVRRFTLGAADGTAGLSIRRVGRSTIGFDPTLQRRTQDYLDIGLSATIVDGPWTLDVEALNLLDNADDIFAFGNPYTIRYERQRTPLRPRTVQIRLGRRF